MADNYLEKRYEEVFGSGAAQKGPSIHKQSIDTLLLRNRSYRGFRKDYVVHQLQLDAIVAVNSRIASSVNAQRLRFRTVTKGPDADAVMQHIRFARGLPDLHLPFPGTEPEAFIIVCSTIAENASICIDLGISLQSMLLKAVDLGLGGIIIRNFDREPIREALGLPLEPIAVVAIGKPAEQIELVPVHEGDSLAYYRRDGVHYVPKLTPEDLKI